MPDDDRKRRRLGDETKGRIADLASGWDTPGERGADAAPAPSADAPRRKKQKTPPPGSMSSKSVEDALLDLSEDMEAEAAAEAAASQQPADFNFDDLDVGDEEEQGEEGDWALPTATNIPRRARRPSASRSGPGEASAVDASGVIPEKTQPPELIVPVPTVDASALTATSGPPAAVIDRGGALGTPRSTPASGAKTGATPPPAKRPGSRTTPPPPPGARSTGGSPLVGSGAATAPAAPASGASGGSGAFPRPTGSGATGGFPRPTGSGASGGFPKVPASSAGDAAAADAPAAPPSSASGGFPRSAGSRASGGFPKVATGGPPIPGSLPLPADAPEGRRRTVPTPPRAARAAIVPDDSGIEAPPPAKLPRTPGQRLAVPIGEFDAGDPEVDDDDELGGRHRRSAVKRNPGSAERFRGPDPDASLDALLAEASAPDRDDPTTIDPRASARRSEPALGPDPTGVVVSAAPASGAKVRLRTIAQLHRRRGVGGDLRYVLTAIFGLRRVRRELAALAAKEELLQQSRRRHLITLGRAAVTADDLTHAALAAARGRLDDIEAERARQASQVTAADAELQRVTRERQATAKQHAAALEEVDAELAELGEQLEPIEKEVATVTRRAANLRDAMRRLDDKIGFAEASLAAAEEEKRGGIEAEIAALKADRKELQDEAPALASSLASLHPQKAKLEAARADARKRRQELEQDERDDQARTDDKLAAIGARRKVVDRAVGDAETARDKILFELGEQLYVDRPASMAPELSPLDAIDVELGTLERRTMELRETLQSVDRWKIVRGVALWILLLAAIGAITALALGVLPMPI